MSKKPRAAAAIAPAIVAEQPETPIVAPTETPVEQAPTEESSPVLEQEEPAAADSEAAALEAPIAEEPAAAEDVGSLEEQLLELGLTIDGDGLVGIQMLTSMSGPDICLNRLDPHRCDPTEAIRLTRAEFARPAK